MEFERKLMKRQIRKAEYAYVNIPQQVHHFLNKYGYDHVAIFIDETTHAITMRPFRKED